MNGWKKEKSGKKVFGFEKRRRNVFESKFWVDYSWVISCCLLNMIEERWEDRGERDEDTRTLSLLSLPEAQLSLSLSYFLSHTFSLSPYLSYFLSLTFSLLLCLSFLLSLFLSLTFLSFLSTLPLLVLLLSHPQPHALTLLLFLIPLSQPLSLSLSPRKSCLPYPLRASFLLFILRWCIAI